MGLSTGVLSNNHLLGHADDVKTWNPALREVAATSRKDKIISENKQYINKSYRTSLVTSTTQSLER